LKQIRPCVARFRQQNQTTKLVRSHVKFDGRCEGLAHPDDMVIAIMLPGRFGHPSLLSYKVVLRPHETLD